MSKSGRGLPIEVKNRVLEALKSYEGLSGIIGAVGAAGGRAILVGGAVRDAFLDLPIKDMDIEVHALGLDALEGVLKRFGPVSEIGKSYGVLKLHGLEVDWSVPRQEGPGRKPEVRLLDPSFPMGLSPNVHSEDTPGVPSEELANGKREEVSHGSEKEQNNDQFLRLAFERRDLTINAMGIDLHTFELIDPFNGLSDLKHKILRATNPDRFIEDPLRFYRVLQFMSRFEMRSDAELTELCTRMDISTVSKERIEEEFQKLLLKSQRPSIGLRWLNAIGRIKEVLPELAACVGVDQGSKWHPEGDVFEHSMQATDAMARLIHTKDIGHIFGDAFTAAEIEFLAATGNLEMASTTRQLTLMYGALCHDLGKPLVENVREDDHVTSYGHAEAGVPAAKAMLKRIMSNQEIIEGVIKLVGCHMQAFQVVHPPAGLAAVKRLASRLAPEDTLYDLALLVTADQQGRGANGVPLTGPRPEAIALVKRGLEAHVLSEVEKPILMGRDLMGLVEPGPKMGRLLDKAYKIQIDEGIRDKNELLKRLGLG